ncbi:MAG TPA: thioredoxin domain-containing protein [Acidimicrobiales bacterium]|nr:thioredoxin domain-containing protein [Acidimicrobiales bacterium]
MNRLAKETSPYLRQHADNPVDWYPWGEEALELAAATDRPLFVSIGYSACHWCHVMAHESFEDERVAQLLNAHFVPVKIDREERPDLDAIYMEAVQAQNGNGGWPMSVFCTPDGRPFYAGTYFPSRPHPNLPAFTQVLGAIHEAWGARRGELLEHAEALTASITERLEPPRSGDQRPAAAVLVEAAVARFSDLHDPEWGGIGRAPKFPQAPTLELLLRVSRRPGASAARAAAMLERSLAAMAEGGLYDHLGGGFHRYSVDREWLVPHFEKMLYDQAALARLYLHAHLATGEERWRQVATETLDYVLGGLAGADGGFSSAEDADSEGEEGRFYLWSAGELDQLLGAAAPEVRRHYGADGAANFEGRYILHRPRGSGIARDEAIEAGRRALLAARAERVRPSLDDKALTEWNAMTLAALAEAGAALGRSDYLRAAEATADFLLARLRRDDGRWLRSYTAGRAAHLAVAADYAWLVEAFVRLAEATGAARWLAEAGRVADDLIELFGAPDGGLFQSGADAPALIVRPRDSYDGVTPAATSVAALALLRLGTLTGEERYLARAAEIVDSAGAAMTSAPMAFPHLLGALLGLEEGLVEIVAPGREDLAALCQSRYLPGAVLAWGERTASPLFADRPDGLAYVCVDHACLAPVGDGAALLSELERIGALAP